MNARAPLLLCLVLGCGRSDPAPVIRAIDAEFAGCAVVHTGPVCELSSDHTLRVWTPASGSLSVRFDPGGAVPPAPARAVEGGRLLRVTVPAGSRELVLEARADGGVGQWRLALTEPVPCPAVEAAAALRGEGRSAQALEALDAAAEGEACAVRGASLRARLLGDLGRLSESAAGLEAAAAAQARQGSVSGALQDRLALVYHLIFRQRDPARAHALLTDSAHLRAGEGGALLAYFEGVLAVESGDFRAALAALDAAAPRAERLALTRFEVYVAEVRARVLLQLGRGPEAVDRLRALLARRGEDLPACDRGLLLTNLGWAMLEERERARSADDPVPHLEQALALYQGSGCPRPSLQANVHLNLALAALQRGDADAADAHLGAARRAQPEPDGYLRDWWRDVEGRIALLRGRPSSALAIYRSLLEAPAEGARWHTDQLMARWRAEVGRGRALEALDRPAEAVEAYRAAEGLLDAQRRLIPLAEGHGRFLRDREVSARLLVDLLVRTGRVGEASLAARRARARVVAALQATGRDTGATSAARAEGLRRFHAARSALDAVHAALRTAAADEVPELQRRRAALDGEAARALDATFGAALRAPGEPRPPGAGELLLVYHPVESGWIGFAVDAEGIRAARLEAVAPPGDPGQLANRLLGPFTDELAAAERVVFLPYGALQSLDLHALPWGGAALLDHAPVAYGLDLPRWPDPSPPRAGALLVVDPRGDLPAARRAAGTLSGQLRAAGHPVEILVQRAATREALLPALERVGLLHYAGHGRFAGRDGWESTLALSGGATLTVGDILGLRRAPALVVLSACETARTDRETAAPTLGLGQAFVVAGAGAVVATTRPVADALAAHVSERLHDAGADAPADPARDLRRALLGVRAADPGADWAAYRLLIP